MDKHIFIDVISKTERPNLVSYLAMHQCYSEEPLTKEERKKIESLSDEVLGERLVRLCIKHGHHSVIEHPTVTFVVSGMVHNVMVQATRHRHFSFSVQSQRYTCDRILKTVEQLQAIDNSEELRPEDEIFEKKKEIVESLLYYRPEGSYHDRGGNKYEYTTQLRNSHIKRGIEDLRHYYHNVVTLGLAPEHARDLLPQNIRQDFIVTMNARSLLHFCDLRTPKDAQPEIRHMAYLIFGIFIEWMPEVARWYGGSRLGKNKLAP